MCCNTYSSEITKMIIHSPPDYVVFNLHRQNLKLKMFKTVIIYIKLTIFFARCINSWENRLIQIAAGMFFPSPFSKRKKNVCIFCGSWICLPPRLMSHKWREKTTRLRFNLCQKFRQPKQWEQIKKQQPSTTPLSEREKKRSRDEKPDEFQINNWWADVNVKEAKKRRPSIAFSALASDSQNL